MLFRRLKNEIIEYDDGLPDKMKLAPARCQQGRKTDNPCPREAATWIDPEERNFPVCLEHARVSEAFEEASEWGIAEEITSDWLRVARMGHGSAREPRPDRPQHG